MEKMFRILVLLSFVLSSDYVLGKAASKKSNGSEKIKKKPGAPIILVPGDGGSQFFARLNKTQHVHFYCGMNEGWFNLWLNLELMLPGVLDCTVDNLRLVYDNKTRTTHNPEGVEITQPGFGNTSTIEYFSPGHYDDTAYFFPIVSQLVSIGYRRGVDIRGAPYDFRKAPNEMGQYMEDLKNLVEDTYKINNNKKVAIAAHSMGNLYCLYFLNRQPAPWKNKYIHSLITLAGPWGGAVKTLRLMASGDNLGFLVVNPMTVRGEQRSMPSTAWMLPYEAPPFWSKDEVLVYSPGYNYTVRDYERYLNDVDFPDGWMMREDTVGLLKGWTHPGVDVHCLHGKGVDTPAGFIYDESDWYDQQPAVINGDGDGTVNMRSLHGCLLWNNTAQHKFVHREYQGAEHMKLLGTLEVIEYVVDVVAQEVKKSSE